MKPLILDSSMTNLSGVFYPTGHVFALFPDEDCARQAAAALHSASHQGELAHASPEFILQEIVRTLGGNDIPLPSVGAEGDMVRRIADLAAKGMAMDSLPVADELMPPTTFRLPLVSTIGGMTLLLAALASAGIVRAVILSSMSPVIYIFLMSVFRGERFPVLAWIGSIMAVVGAAIAILA